MDLKDTIRTIPDFPKEGILFRDVTTLFKDPAAYRQLIDGIVESLGGKQVDLVVGPEARQAALRYHPPRVCLGIWHRRPGDPYGFHPARPEGAGGGRSFGHRRHGPGHHTPGGTGGGTGGSRPICHRAFRPGRPDPAAGLRRGRSGQLLTGIGGEISGHYRWSLPLYL